MLAVQVPAASLALKKHHSDLLFFPLLSLVSPLLWAFWFLAVDFWLEEATPWILDQNPLELNTAVGPLIPQQACRAVERRN